MKAELLLEEVARTQKIEVTEEDIGREIAFAAARSQPGPQGRSGTMVAQQRLGALAADIMRRKALDYIVDAIDIADRPEPRPLPTTETVEDEEAVPVGAAEAEETAEVVPTDH